MNNKSIKKINTFLMIMPWLITFCVFWLYPLVYSLVLSFTKYKTLSGKIKFIGIENYSKLLNDEIFWKSLSNTFIFAFGTVPITTAFAIILAVAVNSKFVRFKELFRAAFFIPSVTSLVVIALIFTNLYTKDGYVNSILKIMSLPTVSKGFLLEPSTSLLSIMAMDVWIATGYYMVLFLAGLQTIPIDLYDSARLMGASAWQQFVRITLPLLKPTLLFVVVINTIKSFQIFVEVYVMTKGGPLHSTSTIVYYVYENAFKKSDLMGYASATAYILFMILIVFSLIQMKLLKEK